MSKLFKLKEWLPLNEAVNHFSNLLGESISLADIYKLSLDGHLKLSVMFVNGAKAKKAKLIKSENVKYKKVVPVGIPNFPEGHGFNVPINAQRQISRNYWIQKIEPELISIGGIWDLAMIGAEKADIANRYQQEISGHMVKVPSLVGHYIQRDSVIYQLQVRKNDLPIDDKLSFDGEASSDNDSRKFEVKNDFDIELIRSNMKPRRLPQYHLASKLDDIDNVLVVRTSEVTRFIQSLEDKPQEAKPLHDKERTTLLLLLASSLAKANIDINAQGVAAKIRRATESNNTPISEETIRKLLPQLRDIVELKQRN